MPSTPLSWRASLTASSFEVWMIASTFVIGLSATRCSAAPGQFVCRRPRLYSSRYLPGISLFAVLGQIEALNLFLFRHPQPDDEIYNLENDERTHDRKHPRDYNAHELIEQLMSIPFEQARCQRIPLRIFEDRVHSRGGENTGQQRAQRSACAMDTEGVEAVIVSESSLHLGNHPEAERAGDQSDQNRGHGSHEPGRRRYGDQSRDRTGDRSQSARFTVPEPLGGAPSNRGGSGCEMCRYEGTRGQTPCRQRAARVKPEPSHPQQAGADEAQHHAMRRDGCFGVADALAQIQCAD